MNSVRHLGWFLLAGWTATSLLAAEPPLGCTDAEVSQPSAEPEARWISWVETFGDCMLYAGAFRRRADGSYEAYATEAALPRLVRTAWSWESGSARPGDMLCWVGLHNCVNNEAFLPPSLQREQLGLPVPCYPDGREALGWIPDGQYPANARIYDACCAKDVNGKLAISPSMPPIAANTVDPATGQPKGSTAGLFQVILSRDLAPAFSGHKEGDTVYVSAMSIAKDAAAPFWIDRVVLMPPFGATSMLLMPNTEADRS